MGLKEDRDRIALQERELEVAGVNAAFAWKLGSKLRAMAIERNAVIAIDIRRGPQQLFHCALEGATPDNGEWVRRKSNTVARFHRSSYAMGLRMSERKTNLLDRYGLPVADYAADGGSFPLRATGSGVVGSVTVSGLSQREDHEWIVEALCSLLGKDYEALKLGAEE